MVLEKLEPKPVWEIFENVLVATPRPSKKEARIRRAVSEWTRNQSVRRGTRIDVREDEAGNLLLRIPASPGKEQWPSVLLQGHLDMVCETNRPGGYDFDTLPIPIKIASDGNWVCADGTTLGSDNGIGVSLALALTIDEDSDFVHGPIEVLLTVDEETGLTGAFGMDLNILGITGKLLINLDSEITGTITIGSAGGGDMIMEKKVLFSKGRAGLQFLSLEVSGLLGGHSGVDIHLPRANANKIVARLLSAAQSVAEVRLCSWNGGTKHNAITRECVAVFAVPKTKSDAVKRAMEDETAAILGYYRSQVQNAKVLEPEMSINWHQAEASPCMSAKESTQVIRTINSIPHGYRNFSPDVPELVETSSNLAVVKTEEGSISMVVSARSSVDRELAAFRNSIADLAWLGGWSVDMKPAYPGWKPEPGSAFLSFVKKHYEAVYGAKVKIEAIHAGLECGIIGAHIPGIQMVSIGPTVKGAHTPDEKVKISDVGVLYSLLKRVLGSLPELRV